MSEKTGTRLRTPADIRRYMGKILCRLEKLSDADLKEKAGQISKLGDTWLRAWEKEIENKKIKELEREIYAIKSGKPLAERAAESEESEE